MNRRPTVWLVEDNPTYRQAIHDLLSDQDDLVCAHTFDAVEPLLQALNRELAPDVILMDVQLPGMDGVEGVRRVKKMAPGTDLIMLTIQEDNETIFRAIQAGAAGYLLKTAPIDELLDAIHTTAEGGAVMSPEVARRALHIFTQMSAPRWDYDLTEREAEVLEELVKGGTKAQIADTLCISQHTVVSHLRHIYDKLHVNNRTEAVVKAVRERLVD